MAFPQARLTEEVLPQDWASTAKQPGAPRTLLKSLGGQQHTTFAAESSLGNGTKGRRASQPKRATPCLQAPGDSGAPGHLLASHINFHALAPREEEATIIESNFLPTNFSAILSVCLLFGFL